MSECLLDVVDWSIRYPAEIVVRVRDSVGAHLPDTLEHLEPFIAISSHENVGYRLN